MVVNDFYLVDIAFPPDKAYPPLIVNADAVSARSPALQSFQAIGRRDAKVVQNSGIVEHTQLAPDHGLDILRQTPRNLTLPNLLSFLIREAFDHSITPIAI
jgi:hypothetical protein